jgi:hypothetical protein
MCAARRVTVAMSIIPIMSVMPASPVSASRILLDIALHCGFVKSGGLALLKCNRSRRTDRKAISESVAVIVPQKFCLPVHHPDGALMASLCAKPAAVTFPLVDFDNLAFHLPDLISFNKLTLLIHPL